MALAKRARAPLSLAVAAFVLLGLPDGALGAAWPALRLDLDQPVAGLGAVLAVLVTGHIASSFAVGPVMARLGAGPVLMAAAAVSALGLVGFAAAPSWPALLAATVVLGAGNGALDASLNAHAAVAHPPRVLNALHAAYAIGATAGPALIAVLLAVGAPWRAGYVVLGVLQVLLLLAWWRVGVPGPGGERAEQGGEEGPAGRGSPAVALGLVTFLVYVAVEVASGQWAASVLVESRGFEKASAGAWVAAYWGGLTTGRILATIVAGRAATAILRGGVLLAAASLALFALDPAGAGVLALPFAGLGFAPVFPTLMALTPGRVGPEVAEKVVAWQVAASGVGAAAGPALIGVIVGQAGIGVVGPLLVGGAAVLTACTTALLRPRSLVPVA